jgi:hypothetical protein
MSEKPKIYILAGVSIGTTRTMNKAIAEDGETVAQGESPSLMRAQHDMGLTSGHAHNFYSKKYPDGYELEFVSEPDRHDGLKRAIRRSLGEVVLSAEEELEQQRVDAVIVEKANDIAYAGAQAAAKQALADAAEVVKTIAENPTVTEALANGSMTLDVGTLDAAMHDSFDADNTKPLLVPVTTDIPSDEFAGYETISEAAPRLMHDAAVAESTPTEISLPEIQQQASEVDGSSPSVAPEKAI